MNLGSNEGRKGELTEWLAEHFAVTRIELTVVCGDASFRCYYRLKVNGTSYIAVDAPADSQNNPLFVAMAAVYSKQKLLVPEVIKADFEEAGDEDVYRKVSSDLGALADEATIRTQMTTLMAQAKAQVMDEVS